MSLLEAVEATFDTLAHWEIYAAALIYVLLSWTPIILAAFLGAIPRLGTLFGATVFLISPVVQGLAIVVFVFSIAPIALGFSDSAAWHLPWQVLVSEPWWFLKSGISVAVPMFLFGFIPIIGRLTSLSVMLGGAIALKAFIGFAGGVILRDVGAGVQFRPDLYLVGGMFIFGVLLNLAAAAIWAVASAIFPQLNIFSFPMIVPVGATLGFVPFLVYASWIGEQINL